MLVCRKKAAAIEPQYSIGEPDVRTAHFPADLYSSWDCYTMLNNTRNMLKNQTTAREQSLNVQSYQLDIKRVRFVSNRCVWSIFVTNYEVVFQVPASLLSDFFGVANSP